MNSKTYPSKLLLFGEYSVINGGQALAVPFGQYRAFWAFEDQYSDPVLKKLLLYLKTLQREGRLLFEPDWTAFETALSQGLLLQSNIPQGFGLGSSGALSAAVYDQYVKVKETRSLELLKKTSGSDRKSFSWFQFGYGPTGLLSQSSHSH